MHLVQSPTFCITIVSNFSWALQPSQEKSKRFGKGGAWGKANKVHYGLCGDGEMVTEMNPYPFVTRNLKFRYYNSTKLLRTFPFYRFQLSEAWAFFSIWGFRNVKENFSNVFYISSLGISRSTKRSSFFTSIRLNSQSWIPATYWLTRKTWWDISKRKQLAKCDFNWVWLLPLY